MLNYESKDRKQKNYYNPWQKVKDLLVGSTRLSNFKSNSTYGFPQHQLKGKNSYTVTMKKATEQVIFTSC